MERTIHLADRIIKVNTGVKAQTLTYPLKQRVSTIATMEGRKDKSKVCPWVNGFCLSEDESKALRRGRSKRLRGLDWRS